MIVKQKNSTETMHKLYSYDITFKEVPGEISLTLAFSGCKNNCEGCHSPHLRGNEGRKLTKAMMHDLLKRYKKHVTVVTFLGGESEAKRLAPMITAKGLDVCLYTSSTEIEVSKDIRYLKIGAYEAEKGGLDSPTTNQRMFDKYLNLDITYKFQENNNG